MNYGMYDTICCKHCFYLLICKELSFIDQGNQSITNNNKYNEYNYNLTAIKFQCIFGWLLLQCEVYA